MEEKIYQPSERIIETCSLNDQQYKDMYQESLLQPEKFWGEIGKSIDWIKPYSKVKNTSFSPNNVAIKWYEDGSLNVSANCVDRHLEKRGDKIAIIWEADEPGFSKKITPTWFYPIR